MVMYAVPPTPPPDVEFDVSRSAQSVDNQGAAPVVEVPSKTASSFHFTISAASETQVAPKNPCRRAIMVTQLGTVDVWIGFSSSVSKNNGDLLVGIKGAFKVYGTMAEVHAIADSASSDISVVELSE